MGKMSYIDKKHPSELMGFGGFFFPFIWDFSKLPPHPPSQKIVQLFQCKHVK